MEQRRSTALGILATPARALAMLQAAAQPALDVEGPASCEALVGDVTGSRGSHALEGHVCGSVTVDPDRLLPRSTLIVHVSDRTLLDGEGLCRAEGVGPVTVSQLRRLLGNTRVTVRPVIHPAGVGPVDCYEIPEAVRRAVVLRHPFEVWPYGTRSSGSLDLDHTVPYRWDGTPAQTRVGNLGPLSRRTHRAKTHAGWRVTQPEPGRFVWRSPLGRRYVVTTAGLTLDYTHAPCNQPWDDPTGGPLLPERPPRRSRRVRAGRGRSGRSGKLASTTKMRTPRPAAPLRR